MAHLRWHTSDGTPQMAHLRTDFYGRFERLREERRNVVRDAATEVRQVVLKLTEMRRSVY